MTPWASSRQQANTGGAAVSLQGPSPRVRGAVDLGGAHSARIGTIPAPAGMVPRHSSTASSVDAARGWFRPHPDVVADALPAPAGWFLPPHLADPDALLLA